MRLRLHQDELKSIAEASGLRPDDFGGAIELSPLDKNTLHKRLEKDSQLAADWLQKNYHGEMAYMGRDPQIFTSTSALLPELVSILSFSFSYTQATRASVVSLPRGWGRVASYAWGRDYHRYIKKRLKQFVAQVRSVLGEQLIARIFVDAVPLLERSVADEAFDNGFIGKNTLFIRPGKGSYSFLAEILWNVEVVVESNSARARNYSCNSCQRCLDKCPTAAFVSERVLDARRCISYLSIEKKGALKAWESEALGDWVFGCDICQDVCPFNHKGVPLSDIEAFSSEQSGGRVLNLQEVLKIRAKEEFLEQFSGTALMRAGRESLLRNAAAVAANTSSKECIGELNNCLREDSSEIVRSAAGFALERLCSEG